MSRKPAAEQGGGFWGLLKAAVLPTIQSTIRDKFDDVMDTIEERLLVLQGQLLRSLAVAVLAFVAGMSAVLALVFFLIDTMGISRAVAFLVFALALGIGALLVHFTRRRHR